VLERYAPAPVVANAFCLNGSVEPFDVGIVVGAMESTMSDLDVATPENLFKVPTVLWAIVTLYHSERKAKDCLSIKYSLSG
jgi:hypothetical protein